MKALLRPFQLLYCVWALLWFAVLVILTLPFLLISLPYGRIRGGNMVYRLCNFWGVVWYFLIGMRHEEIVEAPVDRDTNYVFVANHISYMDIPAILRSIHQPVRILGKSEMASIPLFGLIYRQVVILVDRVSAEQRARSVRALKAALTKDLSVFVFPEGTFNQTGRPLKSFYNGAFRVAIQTGTPIKPLLFLDTHDRLDYRSLFSLTPGRNRTVYLETIPVDGYGMSDLARLKQHVFDVMEAGLLRYSSPTAAAHKA